MSDTVIEKDNYLRFIIFFIDVGKDILLKAFAYIDTKYPGIVLFPMSKCQQIEKKIRQKFPKHLHCIILEAKSPAEFDISILSRLLCNVFPYMIPADLKNHVEHLRKIRNNHLAHPTESRFSNAAFEQLWQETANSFKDIIDEVDPGYKASLETTIEEYKNQPIDATKAREYIGYLETQIEALRKELFDYTTLCKNIQTPFLQYVKFLLNCGSSILCAYLCQLLEKQNVSIERLLYDKHALMSRKLPEWMTQQLYSRSEDTIEVNIDTKSWDLSLLAAVIEIIFGKDIEEYDLTAIISIKKARENYAYTAIFAITKDDRFNREREDLVASLKTLAMHAGPGSYAEFKRFLEEYRSSSGTDAGSKEYFAKLKCHGPGIKDIKDLHRESVEKLTAETGSTVFVNEKYELEVMLQIACEDSSKQAEAESFLQSLLEPIIANPNSQAKGQDFPEVRTTIRKINNIPTVRLTCVQKSCLLITVECRSSQGLWSLINFVDGSEFLHQLDLISAELKNHFDDVFILHGHFTLESLVKTLRLKDKESSSPYSMEAEDVRHDPKTIYKRQQEIRETPKTDILLESRTRQDRDTLKSEAVIKTLHKELETAKKRVKELQHENASLQMKNRELKVTRRVAKKEIAADKLVAEQPTLVLENTTLTKRLCGLEKVNTQLYNEKEIEVKNRQMSDWLLASIVYTAIHERQLYRRARNQLYDLKRYNSHLVIRMLDSQIRNTILTNEISKLEEAQIQLKSQMSSLETDVRKAERKQIAQDLMEMMRVQAKMSNLNND